MKESWKDLNEKATTYEKITFRHTVAESEQDSENYRVSGSNTEIRNQYIQNTRLAPYQCTNLIRKLNSSHDP